MRNERSEVVERRRVERRLRDIKIGAEVRALFTVSSIVLAMLSTRGTSDFKIAIICLTIVMMGLNATYNEKEVIYFLASACVACFIFMITDEIFNVGSGAFKACVMIGILNTILNIYYWVKYDVLGHKKRNTRW